MSTSAEGRRKFLQQLAIGGTISLVAPALLTASNQLPVKKPSIQLSEGDVIVFQGDSITDTDRNRSIKDANNLNALGYGYTYLCAVSLLCNHAEKRLSIYNRGISGNTVTDLHNRWEEDCLQLKPTIISILIGVNDFWSTLKGGRQTYQDFVQKYATLLDATRQRLPDAQILLAEPFAVNGVMYVDQKWYPAFNDYQQAVKELARTAQATFIPYQYCFNAAQKKAPAAYWCEDGVHPSIAGHQLMAQQWLHCIKK